jgi:hypothetical protein
MVFSSEVKRIAYSLPLSSSLGKKLAAVKSFCGNSTLFNKNGNEVFFGLRTHLLLSPLPLHWKYFFTCAKDFFRYKIS